MRKLKSPIKGHLDIIIHDLESESDGEIAKWWEALIHGNPKGLRSFGKLLIKMANLNQDKVLDLPIGAREHLHLQPKWDLSKSSVETIVGRIDAKGTEKFYDSFISK